jgi:MoaA/NifB/PqqE/SkfB family radical SAM enzyme
MLRPSLACQARCSYCFGPNQGPVMRPESFDAALDWIAATTLTGQSLEITFHGGEPLIAGPAWYRHALPRRRRRFGDRLKLGIQSNLWLLDDETCELFREHLVSVGTSLDGPEAINDAQRGAGYYAHTMAGIETARRHGLGAGVICTFTRRSAPHYREVFEFFAGQGLGFSVHAAVCGLDGARDDGLALTAQEKAGLFVELFDYYQANVTRTRISTFDSMGAEHLGRPRRLVHLRRLPGRLPDPGARRGHLLLQPLRAPSRVAAGMGAAGAHAGGAGPLAGLADAAPARAGGARGLRRLRALRVLPGRVRLQRDRGRAWGCRAWGRESGRASVTDLTRVAGRARAGACG